MAYDVPIKVICRKCKTEFLISCTPDQKRKLAEGKELIQDIFPELSPDKRELFISGLCGKCFDELFSNMEEE